MEGRRTQIQGLRAYEQGGFSALVKYFAKETYVKVDVAHRVLVYTTPYRGSPVMRAISRGFALAGLADKVGNLISKGDLAEAMAEQDLSVTYDPYTESILAEVMSSQQTESRLESAPRFIRPKKKKKLLYK